MTEAAMKKTLIAGALVCALMAPAMAADMSTIPPLYGKAPASAPWSWTGVYVGGNVGGHWGTDSITSASDPLGWTVAGAAAIDSSSPTSLHPEGILGGGQAGYNWQFSSFVLGLEADMNWPGGTATRTLGVPAIAAGDFMTNSTSLTFLATVRSRLGVTIDHALLYVTGGLAIGTVQTTDTFSSFGGTSPGTVSSASSRAGWTVGAGVEYALTRNWSVKGEYLHVDLGTDNTLIPTCPACVAGSDITVSHKYTDEIARAGVNFKFD
jgi:outer membrane immunogenic protein